VNGFDRFIAEPTICCRALVPQERIELEATETIGAASP
jgi:hypothetical protein